MQLSVLPETVLFTAICVGIVISLATLFVSVSASREGRRISKTLEERLSKVEHDLQRARWAEKDAQKNWKSNVRRNCLGSWSTQRGS